jgi:cytochrome c-type biogenesis protein CcmF
LMPWLSATAFLHTAMLGKRKNSFNRWNLFLIILTFVLVIIGTFLTRSGVLSSVHAFSGSEIGPPFFVFTAIITLGAGGLLAYRWQDFSSAHQPEFMFSRETLTLFTNLILLSILMVCFLGVIYPIISELLTDTQVTVGPAWYERINGPLFILLLLLMGVCPLAAVSGIHINRLRKRLWVLLPLSLIVPLSFWIFAGIGNVLALAVLWIAGLAGLVLVADYAQGVFDSFRRDSRRVCPAFWAPLKHKHRKVGGALVHLGIVLMSVGIIGIEGLQQETQATLSIGESVVIGAYTFEFEGVQQDTRGDGRIVTEAVLTIIQDGKPSGALYPQREIYPNMGLAITHPGLKSNLAVDLYAILMDWRPESQDIATFRIYVNPLVNWLWIGTGLLTFGTVIAAWPDKRRSNVPAV